MKKILEKISQFRQDYKNLKMNNQKKIAIIGAGWLGCHIASELLNEKNKYNVHLFEKEKDIFLGASGLFNPFVKFILII